LLPSGVSTYVGNLCAGLTGLGIDWFVLTQNSDAAQPLGDSAVDISRLEAARERLLDRLYLKVLDHVATNRAVRTRIGGRISAALRAVHAARPIDLFEVEESYGIAEHVRAPGIPLVLRAHGPWLLNGPALGMARDRAFRDKCAAERRAAARADALSFPSQHVLDAVRGEWDLQSVPCAVIPNPGPVLAAQDRWDPAAIATHRILYVGRFDRIKGADVLLRAFETVAQRVPDAELTFVGPDVGLVGDDGKLWRLEEYLRAHLSARAAARVKVLGTLGMERIRELRRSSAVTVISSRQENFPLAAVEAISFGCPTVASASGGTPEIVLDGESGLLFRNADAEDLARKVLALLEDHDLARRLGERAAVFAKRFDPRQVAADTAAFYADVLEAYRSRSSSKHARRPI
jgi:glycosyltransferase involved in cell wall biosynthesis